MSAVHTKSTPDPDRCCALVSHYIGLWYQGKTQCTRCGSVERGGKRYCRQHDPEAVKLRDNLRSQKHDYETSRRALGWYGTGLYDALEATLQDAANVTTRKNAERVLRAAKGYRVTLRKGAPK